MLLPIEPPKGGAFHCWDATAERPMSLCNKLLSIVGHGGGPAQQILLIRHVYIARDTPSSNQVLSCLGLYKSSSTPRTQSVNIVAVSADLLEMGSREF